MNEQLPPLLPDHASCLLHLVALKYLLAGDLESAESLNLLHQRVQAIDWEDANFIQFSAAMRDGSPSLTPEQEAASVLSLPALTALFKEQAASNAEAVANLKAIIYQHTETLRQREEVRKLTDQLARNYTKAIDHLKMLGADVSEYQE